MPADHYLQFPPSVDNPLPLKKRSAADVRAEIARVDAALREIEAAETFDAGPEVPWQRFKSVSVPIALRSLRHYRQRLARAGR